MKKFLCKFAAPFELVKIIARFEPLYLLYALPQIILTAALPILYVYFPKLIIQELTSHNSYSYIIKVITLYACILLSINIANVFLNNKCKLCAEKLPKKLRNEIGGIIMELELKDIESSNFRDIIQLANNATGLTQTIGLLQNIVSNIITIIGLTYIIVQLDYLFVLLVCGTLIIKIIFEYNNFCFNKKMRTRYARNNRMGDYIFNISHGEGGAKEIRLNNLQKWFTEKIKYYRDNMLDIQFKSFKRYAIYNSVTAIIMALQSFLVLWLLSSRYIGGTISIADFTMYFSAVISITVSLSAITEQIGNYNQQILSVADYKKLVDIKNSENNEVNNVYSHFAPAIPLKAEFVFRNVSFSYPNTERQILKNINITITDKEKLVVVGLNGAGKTTFIKLLCKFYRPTSGTITLGGIDIWDIPNDEYYKIIAAVFQDFANFAFSLKENVSMSENGDTGKASEIIGEVGLGEYARELPNGYETYLSKNFDSSGVELSGGQGQKVAIARAIYKDTPVLILDEPTASLDPIAESEIYTNFFSMAKDKTTIFISHRLAASTIADNIAVFSDGRIEEYGTHSTLMDKNGIYAEMYRKQSRPYIDESKIF